MNINDAPPDIARVLLVGPIASGKSTAARRIAEMISQPLVSIDSIMLDSDNTPKPREAFIADAESYFQSPDLADGWVADGSFRSIRHLTWEHADVIGYLRPSIPINLFYALKRGITHDTRGGNSGESTNQQLRRVIRTRASDLRKLDETTQEFEAAGTMVLRSPNAAKLVRNFGKIALH